MLYTLTWNNYSTIHVWGVRSLLPDDFQGAASQLIRVPCRFLGNSGKISFDQLPHWVRLNQTFLIVPDTHIYIYIFIDIDTMWGAFPTWIDSLKLSNCSDGFCTKFSAQKRDQTRCLQIPVILSPDHYVSYIYIIHIHHMYIYNIHCIYIHILYIYTHTVYIYTLYIYTVYIYIQYLYTVYRYIDYIYMMFNVPRLSK